MSFEENSELIGIAKEIRKDILNISHLHNSAHLGSSLSLVDILTVLMFSTLNGFEPKNYGEKSDQLILSKGHAALALYVSLRHKGFISESDLNSYSSAGSIFEEHPNFKIPTVLTSTGSLGHGLAFANGLALGNKAKNIHSRIFVVMSDGECNEGTVWESALLSYTKNLSRVTVIVDHNKFQATGPITESLGNLSLRDIFESFGWNSIEIDGHDIGNLVFTFSMSENNEKPTAIICNTIKGKGVSFMENNNNWHYKSPNSEELNIALREIS